MHLGYEASGLTLMIASIDMSFEEFQHLARLYVVGALELDELWHFEEGMRRFGDAAEKYVHECRRLESVFALSLRPGVVKDGAKSRLLSLIRNAQGSR
jgi:hypothetical protein